MFGVFTARCPVDTYEKTWTEWRMRWLAHRFGLKRMLDARVILPKDEFFPEPFEKTFESVRRLLDRLCGYMAVDPQRLDLEICADEQLPGAAGHYDSNARPIIRIRESQLDDPERLVATLVHELSHEILLGGGFLKRTVHDHESITDLLPVFLGIGIFGANATVRHETKKVNRGWSWKIGKQGYLTSRVFGYAFALFAFMREEMKPEWAQYLRPDAALPMRDGLRFLRKSDDCLFHPNTTRAKSGQPPGSDLATRIQAGSPTIRLAGLWEARELHAKEYPVVVAVCACLKHRDPAIAAAAADTLGALAPDSGDIVMELIFALSDNRAQVRANAARALGALRCEPDRVIPELEASLDDASPTVAVEAAFALGEFGETASISIPRVLAEFRRALSSCKHSLADAFAATLASIAPDPEAHVRNHFAESDYELFQLALAVIERKGRSRRVGASIEQPPPCE